MAIETELKLSLTLRAASQLMDHPVLSGIEPQRHRLVSTYFDTLDHRLRGKRIVVRYRRKENEWLLAVKTAGALSAGLAQRGEWETAGTLGEFDFSHVDDKSVREAVESARDQLQAVFTTDFTRHAWLLASEDGGRVELALDRGWIVAQERRQRICEVELELLSGSVGKLFDIVRQLQETLSLHPEVRSKSERAYALALDGPLSPVKACPVLLAQGMRTTAAFGMIAQSCLSQLQGNELGVCVTDQPEFIHQARVGIRRLRSAIRLWEPLLPEDFVARFEPLWRNVASKLGDARNWDVFASETLVGLREVFGGRPELETLARYADRRRAGCRRAARRLFKSADYSRLLIEFGAALIALPEEGGKIEKFVPRCLGKRAKRVAERAATAVGGDDAARHRLRVAFKQLRYALEFFAPIIDKSVFLNYHEAASVLQDLLGRLNDLSVAAQLVAEALPAKQGQIIQDGLQQQTAVLLPEMNAALNAFLKRPVPWE
ncbi:MAG: CYTH and CHAD domain-containing protein [Candidatus Accumulibacter sp.]|nr:CYTH and CHAD domain-containing protein [Accumulibacter sp.]